MYFDVVAVIAVSAALVHKGVNIADVVVVVVVNVVLVVAHVIIVAVVDLLNVSEAVRQ